MQRVKLSTVIREEAAYAEGKADITNDARYGILVISDKSGEHDDIVLQGDEYTDFMREVNGCRTRSQVTTREECIAYVASEYIFNLWTHA